jgi:hypothetical protein
VVTLHYTGFFLQPSTHLVFRHGISVVKWVIMINHGLHFLSGLIALSQLPCCNGLDCHGQSEQQRS